jgi:PKD repeat protein
LTTTLTASATGGQPPYTYAWDFGDGTNSTLKSPSHTYSATGSFTATVTVSDAGGRSSQVAAQLNVYAALIVSPMSAAPTTGLGPLQVTFTANASGGLGPYAYTWTFGDGASGSGPSATHSYGGGTFHPTLTVTDAAGGTWTGSAGTISSTSPAVIAPPAGPPAAPPATTTAPSPSPSPVATPSTEPSASAPAPPGANSSTPSTPGPGPSGVGTLLILVGSLFVTGLGGAVFLGWLRRRSG